MAPMLTSNMHAPSHLIIVPNASNAELVKRLATQAMTIAERLEAQNDRQ